MCVPWLDLYGKIAWCVSLAERKDRLVLSLFSVQVESVAELKERYKGQLIIVIQYRTSAILYSCSYTQTSETELKAAKAKAPQWHFLFVLFLVCTPAQGI